MKSLILLLISLALVSCSNDLGSYPDAVQKRVFSTTAEELEEDEVLTMVKLKTPALFSTAKVEEGKIVVDQNQLDALKKEQESFLKEVKKLSSKIEVLYRYQYTLNGFTLKTPESLETKIQALSEVSLTQRTTEFAAPIKRVFKSPELLLEKANELKNTSVKFIGTLKAQEKYNYKGKGLHVGVIDTGIDFTHKMFAGPGEVSVFKSVDPKVTAPSELYPNPKVVGGIDLVGDNYVPSTLNEEKRLPRPDDNPIDISGHGSHVAGTVAGIGNGIDSYDGVAPLAKLHAIKVFGGGSTGDFIVLAGFEYAADPNNDNDPSDALDVLNLSLGGAYGIPGNLYESAIKNLTNVGISVVASAGNSGDVSYITGAPGTSTEALSVGASIDNMDHNWRFDAISIESSSLEEKIITGFGTSSFSISLDDVTSLKGSLVYAGVAAADFDQELKDKLNGNIALIDRGQVSFVDKAKRALDAGAIAVIIANNQPGLMTMGGSLEEPLSIPVIMITKDQRDIVKKILDNGDEVIADLKSNEKEEKPELIDTLTNFSSRGPRSLDSAIKPEIVGPGQQIISADAGTGTKMARLNGTSMSGPHLAGVMALMKEAYPELSVVERKAILIGSALPISDEKGVMYPVSRQGAGRVQVLKAVEAKLFSNPATLSLGEVNVKNAIVFRKEIELVNTSNEDLELKSKILKTNKLEINLPEVVKVEANSKKRVKLQIKILGEGLKQVDELDAIISFSNENKNLVLPILAVAKRLSEVKATSLSVLASRGAARGAAVDLTLKNESAHEGIALIFNKLLSDDRRIPNTDLISLRNNFCDFQSSGYRIVNVNNKRILEVAAKTYGPQEVWSGCQLRVQVDADGDGEPDQEVRGTTFSGIPGLSALGPAADFKSFLLDYKLSQKLRKEHEARQRSGDDSSELSLFPAVQDVQEYLKYDHSTLSVVKIDITKIMKQTDGQMSFRVVLDSRDYEVNEQDDFAGDKAKWTKLNLFLSEGAFTDMPNEVSVAPMQSQTIEMTKGAGEGDLILYYPYNMTTRSLILNDRTQQVLKPQYSF